MKQQLIIGPLFVLATVGCVSTDRSVPVVDDAGHTHYTLGFNADNKGSYTFPVKRDATGKKTFIFDPKTTAWAAYDAQGNRVKREVLPGGKDYCEDVGRGCRTVTGVFRVYSKKGEECTSSIYPVETGGGARMPYCMHFNGGYSIHAAYEVPNWNTSHGCIRVLPSAAKWLNESFLDVGSAVIVKSY